MQIWRNIVMNAGPLVVGWYYRLWFWICCFLSQLSLLFFFQFSASTLIPMEMLKHNFMIALCSHNHTCYTMKNIETCMFIQQPATKYKDDAHVKRAGRSFVVIKINKTYKFYFEFCWINNMYLKIQHIVHFIQIYKISRAFTNPHFPVR